PPVADDWTKPPPGTSRNDFYWLTPGDFLHHQLGRRLNYPGFYTTNDYIGGGIRPFGVDAALVLASRFTIFDPSASDSTVEQALKASIATNSSAPYPNSQAGVDAWFK